MTQDQMRGAANAAFRFVVAVDGEKLGAFTECTLPTIEWDVAQVPEGGLNFYVHQLPRQRKPSTLQLKNGVGQGALLDWYIKSMDSRPPRKTVTVSLLNAERESIITWRLANAFPTKWEGTQLKSDATTVAVQTLVLACGEVTVSYD